MSGRPPALMLQGTSSHAGKTVLVAGLCRLLARHGLRVLPFKSQNMSLNAWVTGDGKQMGLQGGLDRLICSQQTYSKKVWMGRRRAHNEEHPWQR
ncbi:MAG TPA: hypothetical protein DCQ64_33325 [Candidatus Rokubacteria bacterium]|nr:hypothetical protein [Candidatus Rokubacteria bacterium]